jgi:hypothetical protein
MVSEIGSEFGSLDQKMVAPASTHTASVTSAFAEMARSIVTDHLPSWLTGIEEKVGGLVKSLVTPAQTHTGSVKTAFTEMSQHATQMMGDVFSSLVDGNFTEGFSKFWKGLKGIFEGVLSDMLSSFVNNFLKGMLDAIGAAKLGQSLANSILGGLGILTGGGGGTTVGGGLLGGLFGGGAAGGMMTPEAYAASVGYGGGAGGAGALGALGTAAAWAGGIAAPFIIGHIINSGPMYTPYLSPAQVIAAYQEYFGANYEQQLAALPDLTHVMPGDVPWWTGNPEGSGEEPVIPGMKFGGIVMPQPGGSIVRVAEAGMPEAIVPLDRMMGGSGTPTKFVLELDGRTLGEASIRYIPGAVQRIRLRPV